MAGGFVIAEQATVERMEGYGSIVDIEPGFELPDPAGPLAMDQGEAAEGIDGGWGLTREFPQCELDLVNGEGGPGVAGLGKDVFGCVAFDEPSVQLRVDGGKIDRHGCSQ